MKKIISLLALVVLMTGCSTKLETNFKDNTIELSYNSTFTQDEFKEEYNGNVSHDFTITEANETVIKDILDNSSYLAFKDNNSELLTLNKFENNNGEYNISYNYLYRYDNFNNNYLYNDCFEYFTFYEDMHYRYYKLNGEYTCGKTNNLKFTLKSDYKVMGNNNDTRGNDEYIWNIKETNNDIYFAISKDHKEEKGIVSKWQIIGFSAIIVLMIVVLITLKIVSKKD